jgi:hypothetical protein
VIAVIGEAQIDLPSDALVMVDPNCRPAAIGDRDAYLDRADVVKVSAGDLSWRWQSARSESWTSARRSRW